MVVPAVTPGFFPDPQDTNVPYVAWVGDKVRVVKCEPNLSGGTGNWSIVDWSGALPDGSETIRPSYMQAQNGRSAFSGAGEQSGRACYEMIMTSEKPGLLKLKLETSGATSGDNPRQLTHDFNIIWLSMNAPVLDELASGEIPGLVAGDPLGDGIFNPIDCDPAPGWQGCYKDGYFQVDVTGSFPLGRNYADDLDGNQDIDTVVLPRDWKLLADRYGVSKRDAVDPSGWDIHDDQIDQVENRAADHRSTSICGGLNLLLDEVDNCLGGTEMGQFSRIVNGTNPTIGPFDPLRPSSSYLPDGKVDAGDAPMPALRIDVGVSGGFGALAPADKHVIYSRNATGAADTTYVNNAHNLYAPFYGAYIPATRAPGTSSGTTGDLANDFPGYQNTVGLYHFWDLLNAVDHPRTNNICRDVGGDGQVDGDGAISHPRGVAKATVYTDEHGEAIVRFRPDVGLRLTADGQGLCDLGEISSTPRLAATATISAQAELPFQQAERPIDATPLTKQLFHLAGKSLDCVPKSAFEAYCVETIRDIRGNPVEGAYVAFSREPLGKIEGAELPADPAAATYVGPAGDSGFNTRGAECSDRTISLIPGAANEIICKTNSRGQAGIVVKSTLPGLVDIDAENLGTRNGGFGVERVRCLRFAGDGVTLPTDSAFCVAPPIVVVPPVANPVVPPTSPTVATPASTASTASTATVVSLAGNPVPAATSPAAKPAAKAALAKLSSARLIVVNGKRYLVVRANGTAKTAKIRITLVMRTGKAKAPFMRTIRTNKAVRVANLQINKHVRTVRVAVAR